MEVEFPISKDEDGFVWRQCPTCESKFKWHDGPLPGHETSESPNVYFCPVCGHSADLSAWFTYEQLEAAQNAVAPQVNQMLNDEFSRMKRARRNGMIKIDWKIDSSDVGTTQLETHDDDFEIVASPCHPYEPVKVLIGDDRDIKCLVCGSRFHV